jgi:hypothetical protein
MRTCFACRHWQNAVEVSVAWLPHIAQLVQTPTVMMSATTHVRIVIHELCYNCVLFGAGCQILCSTLLMTFMLGGSEGKLANALKLDVSIKLCISTVRGLPWDRPNIF